ncbi:MAG TPA: ATP cone domain-containing protein [Phycisphaerae bacterium]|nr:ATP cone domain-containing protein [Phycisphaerae bacterium]
MNDPFQQDCPARDVPIFIRKRDQTVEAFEIAKLRNGIRKALCTGADPSGLDQVAAKGLAEAIHEFLKRACPAAPVPSVRVLELAELVLTQTGHAAAGMAMRQYASSRDRLRRWLMVAAPTADGAFIQHRWDKGRLVRHLQGQHLLDAPASRMIAGRVEQLVFNCGLKVVTANLVREMVNSELLAWGLLPGVLAVRRKRTIAEVDKVKDNLDTA